MPLQPGEGLLFERLRPEAFLWREPRPYADPFDAPGGLPAIVALDIDPVAGEAHLTIHAEAGVDQPLYVLYQDVELDAAFDPFSWRMAERIHTRGEAHLVWSDASAPSRPDIADTPARCYLLVRGDLDSDGDGIPDGLEAFVYGTNPYNRDTSGNGIPDDWLILYGIDPLYPDAARASLAGDGLSNLAKYRLGLDPSLALAADHHNRLRLRVATPLE